MRTIIFSTDFSEAALNAAHYAIKLAHAIGTSQIILYHSYDNLIAGSDLPMMDLSSPQIEAQSLSKLEALKDNLEQAASENTAITISVATDNMPLLHGIERLAKERRADLVVAGTTGRSNLEQVLIGSNTINLAASLRWPLLVVPPTADYLSIHQIVFACSLQKLSAHTPVSDIGELLKKLKAELIVLNVAPEGKNRDTVTINDLRRMHALLDSFHPEYHYSTAKDIATEIESFTTQREIGLIVTIPTSHGFFQQFFHRSVSKQLVKRSSIPLLLLREKEA